MVHVTDWLPTLLRAAGGKKIGKNYPELKDLDGYDQVYIIYHLL